MQVEPVITFRGLDPSPLVRALIQRRVGSLAQVNDRIQHCRILVETRPRQARAGRLVRVEISVGLPEADILVTRDSGQAILQRDLRQAIGTAFDAVEAALRQRMQTEESTASAPRVPWFRGWVKSFDPASGQGWLRSDDGVEYPFLVGPPTDRPSQALSSGDRVRFGLAEGEDGPFAKDVSRIEDPGPQAATSDPDAGPGGSLGAA